MFITRENASDTQLIHDIYLHPLKINEDETGILVETLRVDWPTIIDNDDKKFAMQYYSRTNSGIARDETQWHYHPSGQQDRFIVIDGSIVAAIADNREGSPTKGLLNLFLMESRKDPYILLVPKQALHTFMVVSQTPAILLNFPTRLYDPKEEGRIPFEEAKIAYPNGTLFTWKSVREALHLPEQQS